MRSLPRLIARCLLVALAPAVHAAVTDYDGRWSVRATCGINASNGRPGFTERAEWTVAQGRIRETRAQTTPLGSETTTWEGQVEGGRITLDATGRRDNGDVWTWQLTGAAQGNDRMTLAGGLYAQTKKVRDCTMELTALTPAANSLLGKANAAAKTPESLVKPAAETGAKAREAQPTEKPAEAPRAVPVDKRPTVAAPTTPARPAPAYPETAMTKPTVAAVSPAPEPPPAAPVVEPAPSSAPEGTSTEVVASAVADATPAVVASAPESANEASRDTPWAVLALAVIALGMVAGMAVFMTRRRRRVPSPQATVASAVTPVTRAVAEPPPPADTAPSAEIARPTEARPVIAPEPAAQPLATTVEIRVEAAPAAPAAPVATSDADRTTTAWRSPAAALALAVALLASGVSVVATLQSLLVIALCVAAYRPARLPVAVVDCLSRRRMAAILAVVGVEFYSTLETVYLRTLGKYAGKLGFPWYWIALAVALALAVYLLHQHGDAE